MDDPKTYTFTITATDLPPALLMGGPAGRTFGPAFTVILRGDLSGMRSRGAGSEFDLASETSGHLTGKALIPAGIPESGDIQLEGTDEPVRDRTGRHLVAGTIHVDETGQVRESGSCVWR